MIGKPNSFLQVARRYLKKPSRVDIWMNAEIPLPNHRKTTRKSSQCQRCGTEADEIYRFCIICGAELRKREVMKPRLRKQRLMPSIIAFSLLAAGTVALISSIVFFSSILAFIGLGLTFWGALFLFIRPEPYVKAKLLDSTAVSSLLAIDKILSEEALQGKGLYLSPKHGEGLVFIPAKDEVVIPSIDEIAAGKVFLESPRGVCLLSPGYGLSKLFEKELGVDFSKVDLEYLQKSLPRLLVDDLEVVEDFSMNVDREFVEVRMVGSIYKDSCREKLTDICLRIGCPICSAIGQMLAKATGNPVVFMADKLSTDGGEIQARYLIVKVSK